VPGGDCQTRCVAQVPDPRRSHRYRILDCAYDDAAVWGLTDTVTVFPRSGTPFEAWPGAEIDELRPELERLLREGKVELYPCGAGGPALALDGALDEIKRDDAWLPPSLSGRNGFEVVLTPAGCAALDSIADAEPRSTEAGE
jgi:hypothetical protein